MKENTVYIIYAIFSLMHRLNANANVHPHLMLGLRLINKITLVP